MQPAPAPTLSDVGRDAEKVNVGGTMFLTLITGAVTAAPAQAKAVPPVGVNVNVTAVFEGQLRPSVVLTALLPYATPVALPRTLLEASLAVQLNVPPPPLVSVTLKTMFEPGHWSPVPTLAATSTGIGVTVITADPDAALRQVVVLASLTLTSE